VVGLLDRDHYPDNLLDRLAALERRVADVERSLPGRPGEEEDSLAYYRASDGSLRAPQFLTVAAQNRSRATQTAGQSIPNAAWTVIEYDTESYDGQGEYNPATFRFTAAVAGYFAVKAAVMFDATDTFTGGEWAGLAVYRDGALYSILDRKDQLDVHGATTSTVQLSGAADMYLAAGQYVDVRVYQLSGGALALTTSAGYNRLAVHRLS